MKLVIILLGEKQGVGEISISSEESERPISRETQHGERKEGNYPLRIGKKSQNAARRLTRTKKKREGAGDEIAKQRASDQQECGAPL